MTRKLIIYLLIIPSFVWGAVGTLTGVIRDASTQQPLIGANVILKGTDLGAATDLDGNFHIPNVPVGSYTITVTMIGYESISRANIHVVPKRTTYTNFNLSSQVIEGEGVEVTARYFERARDAIASSRSVDIEEIRSDPVGAYDIMAMMQSLPSVISGADQSNEIIVRGGNAGENLFVMDHIEIPFPNHYPEQGKGGGPITMLDTDFIEKVDFFAGSFPARYGDKLSSVMDITLREGNREKHLSEFSFNMAGFGFNFEGPASKKGAYLFSLKRSFLDFVIQQTGLMAIPQYWTIQGKATYNISPTQKLMLNVIGGLDAINIEGEDDPNLRGAENVDMNSNQLTAGITYKNLYSKNGYNIMSFSTSRVGFNTDVYRMTSDNERDVYFDNNDGEWESTLKGDWVYRFKPGLEISTGFNIKAIHLDYDRLYIREPRKIYGYSLNDSIPVQPISTEEFWTNYYGNPAMRYEPIGIVGTYDTVITKSILDYTKSGVYIQANLQPLPNLELKTGIRIETLSYTGKSTVSPRLGLSYHVNPALQFNLAVGRYYQAPFNIQLNSDKGETQELKHYYADQIVAGIEYFLRDDTRLTFEVYNKKYKDMIGLELLSDNAGRDSLNFSKLINGYKSSSQGIEFFIQKKYSNNWYGSLAWAHATTEGIDPRSGDAYPSEFDYGDVVTAVGGYKIRFMDYPWYNTYKETWVAKATSWLPFAPADEFEIGLKLRYMGGRPYTPQTYDPQIREWGINAKDPWNTSRYDDYIRFDILLQQRFFFKRMNMVAFWDIMNVFNRDNPWATVYKEDGSTDMAWQYKTFPVGGIILEF